MSDVLIDTTDGVLAITFNRPDRLNAVNGPMLHTAAEAIEAADEAVRVVLITGVGRAFCSGADLTAAGLGGETLDGANHLILAMCHSPKPVVCAVNGIAAGVGCSIAVAADITIAKSSAYFLQAFINIGLMPDGGGTELIAASIGRARANRMALLGERLTADVAAEIGLIYKSLDDDAYIVELTALVDRFAHGPTVAYGRTKAAIVANTLPNLEVTLAREREWQIALFGTEDCLEGGTAFLQKRPAKFVGR